MASHVIKVFVTKDTKIDVQNAMFARGYGWGHEKTKEHRWLEDNSDLAYLVNSDGIIWRTSLRECEYNDVPEYVLVGNKLILKAPTVPEPEEQLTAPPIGLRPRYIVAGERMCEILDAMHRYVKVGKQVPKEWIDEFNELNYYLSK